MAINQLFLAGASIIAETYVNVKSLVEHHIMQLDYAMLK